MYGAVMFIDGISIECMNHIECAWGTRGWYIYIPHRIDKIIKEKCNAKSIIDVIPGYYNTKITV